ncbi:MAG: LamG-like jellyroll fold domain-containing protein [Fulvivirga sp.]|uniref:LamG-like jellyroll fold domain-containing protein n=1 Tax=Fulvivirga sp. TaxID=1931237 RepID=UPI0032EDB0FD
MNKHVDKNFILILIQVLICSLVQAQNINQGRVAYYEFNGNANDPINGLNGTVFGALSTTDRFGNSNSAYEFDGLDDFISIPHSEIINFNSNSDFSISLWVYLPSEQTSSSGTNNEILGKWNALNSQGYPFAIRYINENVTNGNQFKFASLRYDSEFCNGNPILRSSCPVEVDNWFHIVFIKNESQLTLYQNGELMISETDNTSNTCNTTNNEPLYIGKRQANQRHYKGKIDDILFYNRPLSEEEVDLLYLDNSYTPSPIASSESDILSFEVPEQIEASQIDNNNRTINVLASCSSDLTNLTPSFTLSSNATAFVNSIEQLSEVSTQDFTASVIYTVLAENNCDESIWTVNITNEELSSSEQLAIASVVSFSTTNQLKPAIVDSENRTVELIVSCSTDITNLVSSFVLSDGASATIQGVVQQSGSTANDFSSDLIYSVTSQNQCATLDWTVSIAKETLSSSEQLAIASIVSFSTTNQLEPAIVDSENRTIDLTVSCDTDVTRLVSSFVLSDGASATIESITQQSGGTINDFSNEVIYSITSQNQCVTLDWKINIDKNENLDIQELFIPNIITPNNDGKNDTWIVMSDAKLFVKIYNRWGRVVYQSDNYQNDFQGDGLSTGIYYYQIMLDDCAEIDGWLQVLF